MIKTAAGIIEQAFYQDHPQARSLTIRITHGGEVEEWDGHLNMEVICIERDLPTTRNRFIDSRE